MTTEYGYLLDGHGDVAALVNPAGELVLDYAYDPFGSETGFQPDNADQWDNPFRYCGEYWDEETETYYLRARQYDPEIGRFLSEDTAQDGRNWYIYCYNDPVRLYDPTGNVPIETIADLVSIGFSAKDFVKDPSLVNFGYLALDIVAAAAPYVPGSYVIKGAKLIDNVDDVADTARAVSNGADLAARIKQFKANSKNIVKSYSELKKTVKSLTIKGMEVHHLIEKRFSKALGLGENVLKNTNKFPSVALSIDDHKKITKKFRDIIGYSNEVSKDLRTNTINDAQEVWSAIVDVYNNDEYKHYLPILKDYLVKNADEAKLAEITDWGVW